MPELIECVPNISEGRRQDVIEEIVRAVSDVPGALLLNHSSDPDHNRSVLTLVGSAASLKEAVRRLYAEALKHIDLREHNGEHPRMGVVDVVPFIPIQGVTMRECVALSREVGEMIAREFDVPVFLYAESATKPSRRVLADIRRGEFEGMAAKMQTESWRPDYGPAKPHPSAGASAVGARFFLIAYNIQLDTQSVEVANAVARAVRASSGGLASVQAMGVYLADRKQAQVSMNLLNYEKTPIHQVQEMIKTEAARYGAKVVSAELVGLVPQSALISAAAHYLQIENFTPDLVLENAVYARELEDETRKNAK